MPLWFRELARKSLSGQKSPVPRRSARPRSVSLRLEAVEDRTLASVASLELDHPNATLPAPGTVGTHSGQIVKIPANEQVADSDDQSTPDHPPGLVADASPWGLSGFESPSRGFDGQPVTFADDGKLPPTLAFEESTGPTPSAPSGAPGPVTIERLDSPTAEVARPDKSRSRVSAESAEATTAADSGRVSSDRASAIPTGRTATTAATSPDRPSAATNGQRAADNHTPRPRRVGSPDARATQDDSDRPASRSDSAAPRRGGRSTAPTLPRADVDRLASEVTDGSLLHRFVTNREEAAFTALVRRHERLVLSVCQRVLGDWHAAQDALQTTFLVLARKAGMLDRQIPLTNWLYTVAYHAALRLRAVTARHRITEAAAAQEWPTRSDGEVGTDVERLEIQQAVREELQSLPAEYREPLALCYVDGRTHSDAAREVGLPRGSMAKRLGEGLDRLRERLIDRGVSS